MVQLREHAGRIKAYFSNDFARSSNGRTPGFGPGYWGSSPCRAADILLRFISIIVLV